jgi:hypothetical protein
MTCATVTIDDVEAQVEAMLAAISGDISVNYDPVTSQKEYNP